MTILRPNEPTPPSLQQKFTDNDRDLRALWRRVDRLGKGGGGGGLVLVLPDEPEAEVGQLWFDTDAGV